MSITVAMYSHDSVGLGHARRNRALAYALAADLPRVTGQRVRGLLIAGHPDATQDALPEGWDWLVLPGFTSGDGGYVSRSLDISSARLTNLRSATAAAALKAMDPDLFIVDRHPFGVNGELTAALDMLRQREATTILGLREVLDSPEVAQREWASIGGADAVADRYDGIWVYGDRGIYNPLDTGEIPAALASRTRFTGYLAHGRPEDPVHPSSVRAPAPYVLTMVGGGSDGGAIGLAAARAQLPQGHSHIILTGPQMPAADHDAILDAARETGAAPGAVRVTRYAQHVPKLVRHAAAVVSMCGYNSMAEVMATTTPALVIPRNSRRAEQPRRAAALAAAGAVETLSQERLSPQELTRWFARAVTSRTLRDGIDLDGLTRIGDIAAAALPERTAAQKTTPLPTTVERPSYAYSR
ncbi:glycosyltransferase family protein [Nesterenkonia rhizosphaerae]|uniref:Glycosyltransferase n=1 Tax=Nesterenkonia rhizosphaerae TaxID=1348272 RepID=A0ABP9FXY6_9MICC